MSVDEVGRGCAKIYPYHIPESGFFAIALAKFYSFRADWHQDDRVRPLVQQYQLALDSISQSHPELQRCVACCAHCGIRFLTHPRNASRTSCLRCPFGCRQQHRRQRSQERSAAYYQTPEGKEKKGRLNARRYRAGSTPERSSPQAAGQPGSLSVEPLSAEPLPIKPLLIEPPPSEMVSSAVLPEAVPERLPDERLPDERLPGERLPGERLPGEPPAGDERQVPDSGPLRDLWQLPLKGELRLEGVVLDESSLRISPMLPYVRMVLLLVDGVKLSRQKLLEMLLQVLRQHSIACRRRTDYVLRFLHQHPP